MSNRNLEARSLTPEEDLKQFLSKIETEIQTGDLQQACSKLKVQAADSYTMNLLKQFNLESRFNAAKTKCCKCNHW